MKMDVLLFMIIVYVMVFEMKLNICELWLLFCVECLVIIVGFGFFGFFVEVMYEFIFSRID